ncbi:g2966 [Coccomyxa viridis]|uniref:G2966 protein n=1 Tax=Coccomyxa viridis TaxID=1274662 RepID=A0ABP1FLN5_9CHLO
MQQGRPGGSGAHPARIQVSTSKKPLFFYVNLAKRFLQEHGEVQLSALGLAISSMVTVAEILKSGQWAVERKITTGLDTTDDAGRERPVQKAKMEIIMVKTPQFDSLMEASSSGQQQQQQGSSSDSPDPPAGTPPDAPPDASTAPPSASQASGSGEVRGTQNPPIR